MRPELTGCIQLPTGTVKLELTLATQALIWRCHFSPLVFLFNSFSFSLPLAPQFYPVFVRNKPFIRWPYDILPI